MIAGVRTFAVPAFLLLCLLAGGSRQGAWANAALQLTGAVLIAWAAVAADRDRLTRPSRQLVALIAGGLVIIVLQLVPLPPGLWGSLPGRDAVGQGFDLLGNERPWLPLSLAPYQTLGAAYALLPPIAVVATLLAFGAAREHWIAVAIVAGALASVLLGAVQVGSGGRALWAYLYDITNPGAVGFFANRNHMASLLLAAIPFAAALFASRQPQAASGRTRIGMLAIGVGGFVLVLAGLLLNDSLAALALAVPVIGLSALLFPAGWRLRRLLLPLGALALAVAVLVLAGSTAGSDLGGDAQVGRREMWDATARLIADSFPLGTGLGTFPQVYALAEDPAAIARAYVNHAHNDYLEIILETGLPGLLLLLLFLGWWGWQAIRVWRSPSSSQFAKAAVIASAAILAHSAVDYPLRTAAIGALFAACIGLMAQAGAEPRRDRPRHIRIG